VKKFNWFYCLKKIFRLIRIKTSLIAFIITATISIHRYYDVTNGLVLGLTTMFTACFGFAINEYYDHLKDTRMRSEHVIPLGLMSRRQVLIISCCLFFFSLTLTIFLYPFQQLLNIILLFVLSIYSFINNKNGIIANLLVAVCSCLGILITLNNFEWTITCYSGITFFLYVLGREIILDIHDYEADRTIGKKSFPISFTIHTSFCIAILLSISCILYSVIIGIYFVRYGYILFVCLANVAFLIGLLNYRAKTEESEYKKFVLVSRVSFLLAIPAFLL